MIGKAGGLAEQVGREDRLEHAETEGAAGLVREQADHFHLPALEDVGGLQEEPLLFAGGCLPPSRKRTGGRLDGFSGVLPVRRRDGRDRVAAEGVMVVVGGAI